MAYTLNKDLDQESLLEVGPLEFNKNNLDLLREIDYSVRNFIYSYKIFGSYGNISQMPVVLFPGVERPWVGIRPVSTIDYMTATPVEIGYPAMRELSFLLKSSGEIEGVVFDDTDKPPATIEWK